MAITQPFDDGTVERIAKIVGDTSTGFSGTEVGRLLATARIPDPGEMTKWRRIATALAECQAASRSGNCTVMFVKAAMQPVRWLGNKDAFEDMRQSLNEVLAFSGLSVGKDGLMYRRSIARTHDEAVIAKRMRDELHRRGGHAEVFRYCTRELIAEDCFGAVFEAAKGLAERIRAMTKVDLDGHALVQAVFEGSSPMVALNALRTETERNEQRGMASLIKGVFSAFRNPEAHQPKILWHVNESDALDLLTTLSLVHRRLDAAVVLRQAGTGP